MKLVALLCLMAQGAWAQALVDSETELRDAVSKGGTIQMIGSIQLSSPLTIANGKTVTLDLNTTKLSRNLNSAQGDGSVIHVEKGGSLTILDSNTGHNGTIQGGWATRGGGVYNEGTLTLESGYITQCKASIEGGAIFNTGTLIIKGGKVNYNESPSAGGIYNTGTVTMSGGDIANNKSVSYGGGAIANHGTVEISGGTISANESGELGGGIWNGEGCTLTLNGGSITDNHAAKNGGGVWNKGTLNMKGEVTIARNLKDKETENLYLEGSTVINFTGALVNTSGEPCIGVTIGQSHKFISNGYKTNNPTTAAATFFSADKGGYILICDADDNEIQLANDMNPFTFTVCSWDEASKKVVKKRITKRCIILGGNDNNWVALGEQGKTTWYSTPGTAWQHDVTHDVLVIYGEVHLVLSGDPKISLHHLKLEAKNDAKLYIHNEWGDASGRIEVKNYYETWTNTNSGLSMAVEYHRYYKDAAAIGGGGNANMGSLIMHGGTVSGIIQDFTPAAIGGGKNGCIDPAHQIVVYDGVLKAEAYYPLIKGVWYREREVPCGAAIGGGKSQPQGGPITVYGGTVDAKFGGNGAGIGGGEDASGGTVKIYGGYVNAHCAVTEGGAGIGGGYDGSGGDVHIYGGTVEALGAITASSIGGEGNNGLGTIEFASNMRVTAGSYDFESNNPIPERVFTTAEREDACKWRRWAKIEVCDHTAQNGDKIDAFKYKDEFVHSRSCHYCAEEIQEEHQFPGGATDVCSCNTNISDICYYLYDDKVNEDRIYMMADRSEEYDYVWNVMLKDRTFYHDGNWNTLCLPFELTSFEGTPLEGASVEKVESASIGSDGVLTINLKEVKAIRKADGLVGMPLFVKWPKGTDEVNPRFSKVRMYSGKTAYWFESGPVGTFQPLLDPLDITADNINNAVFLGSDNTLGYSAVPRQLHAMRGYFHISSVNGARAMSRAVINHTDGTTEVVSLEADRTKDCDGIWYDLQGRKLDGEPTKKGLYIHNGKKVMK